ncbi:Acetylornithine deacetylase [archaeon HR04]|nr:Acetylornithine deacetylase [archaeon HR04]
MLYKIKDAVDREMQSIVEDARELIRIPSRNPPGEERRCAEYIHSRLKELGLNSILLHEPYADRPQVIAYARDSRSDELRIVLNGHIDTVPEGSMEGWSVDPFSGMIKDGKMYGRGAADMKSALAVMMHICKIVSRRDLLLCFAIGEERAEPGTSTILKHLRRLGIDRLRYGIVMEPTSLKIATCQMGALWLNVKVRGRSAHASIPTNGINAIVRACKAIGALEAYARDIAKRNISSSSSNNDSSSMISNIKRLCIPRCSVTMITGGVKENVVPDECSFTIDRRVAPYESANDVINEIKMLLDLHAEEYEMSMIAERSPVCIDESSILVKGLSDALATIGITDHHPFYWCFPGSTDNEHIVREGIESIVWGPGSIEQAHAADEHISVEELRLSAYALALLLSKLGYYRDDKSAGTV